MALNFPNQSRSFDTANQRVRFWAYDQSMEIAFFVDIGALRKLLPVTKNSETQILNSFDQTRGQIHDAAQKLYARRQKGAHTYFLTAEDF